MVWSIIHVCLSLCLCVYVRWVMCVSVYVCLAPNWNASVPAKIVKQCRMQYTQTIGQITTIQIKIKMFTVHICCSCFEDCHCISVALVVVPFWYHIRLKTILSVHWHYDASSISLGFALNAKKNKRNSGREWVREREREVRATFSGWQRLASTLNVLNRTYQNEKNDTHVHFKGEIGA